MLNNHANLAVVICFILKVIKLNLFFLKINKLIYREILTKLSPSAKIMKISKNADERKSRQVI